MNFSGAPQIFHTWCRWVKTYPFIHLSQIFGVRERPLTTGGGTENLGKTDLAFLVIPPIKRKWNIF